MQQSILISLMAEDRPGIVELLSDVVAKQKGNWLESRLARLGGQFAGIVRVQVAQECAADLTHALQELNERGITLIITDVAQATVENSLELVRFKVVANDRPGIVQEISAIIAEAGANLEELTTDLGSTPWSGEGLFQAEGLVALPASLDEDVLAAKLESLADDLMVEMVKLDDERMS